MANTMEGIGTALVKGLFSQLEIDVTTYCNAAVDEAFEYCIEEFKKACKRAGIEWRKKWEDVLYEGS